LRHLPKVVVSDIGGTLVRNANKIPEFTGKVLNDIIKKGIPVILITGFNYHTVKAFVQDLDKNIILMPQNGTLCIKDDEVIWEYRIDTEPVKKIYNFLDEEKLPVIVYKGIEDDFSVFYKGRGIIKRGYPFVEIKSLNDFQNITGISTIIPFDKIEIISKKIKDFTVDDLQMIRVREKDFYWLEVAPRKVRKDIAIKRYCEKNQVSLSDVIFFGDNYNDLELLRIVGTPVIVENAVTDLKNEFKTVAESVYNEGVAKYLIDIFNL